MRSIEGIRKSVDGTDSCESPTDKEVLYARKFYDDLRIQLRRCPDLRGVCAVAVLWETKFRQIAQARNLDF